MYTDVEGNCPIGCHLSWITTTTVASESQNGAFTHNPLFSLTSRAPLLLLVFFLTPTHDN